MAYRAKLISKERDRVLDSTRGVSMEQMRKFKLKGLHQDNIAVPAHFSVLLRENGYRATYRFGVTMDLDIINPVMVLETGELRHVIFNQDTADQKLYYLARETSYICEYRKTVDYTDNSVKETVTLYQPIDIIKKDVACRDVSGLFGVDVRKNLSRSVSPLVETLVEKQRRDSV